MAKRLAQNLGKTVGPLQASDELALRSYAWPGNARELRNVVERALITSSNGRVCLDDILPRTRESSFAIQEPKASTLSEILTDTGLRRLERENMIAALKRTGWRIGGAGGAAEMLGLSASTF